MRHPFHEVWTLDVEMWLIAQIKVYDMLMRNLALICKLGHFANNLSKSQYALSLLSA